MEALRRLAVERFPLDELAGRTHRLIERLLDQIDVQERAPTESEDTFLRRSILLYQAKDFKESIGYAFRAAKVGPYVRYW